ncbi:hypothetical protein D3C80_1725730 [compost metagenome]
MKLWVAASIRLGSWVGLSSASLPNSKPLLTRMVRSGEPSEKLVSARLLRLAVICTEISGWSWVTLAKGSSTTTIWSPARRPKSAALITRKLPLASWASGWMAWPLASKVTTWLTRFCPR